MTRGRQIDVRSTRGEVRHHCRRHHAPQARDVPPASIEIVAVGQMVGWAPSIRRALILAPRRNNSSMAFGCLVIVAQ